MMAWLRRFRRSLPASGLMLGFGLLFVYPIGRLLLLPWLPSLGPGGGFHGELAGLPLSAVANTLRLGVASTLVAVPVGVAAGWLLERRQWRGNSLLMLTLWLIFLTPSYLLTTGWQIVFSLPWLHQGTLARLFYSQIGIVALLGLKGMPFATLAARSSWRAIGAEILDAALIHVTPLWQRRGILWRLLLPAAGSALAVVFIESIQEFGIPATLGAQIHLPIITYAIYERLATTPVDFINAARLSWSLVGLALLAAMVHLHLSSRYSGALVHGRQRRHSQTPCSARERRLGYLMASGLGLLGLLVPGIAIVHAALQSSAPANAIPVDWSSLTHSSVYAALGGMLAVSLALLLIQHQRRVQGRLSQAFDLLSLGNMAIPGLVLGAAYVIAFNSSWLPLYGTPALLIIAYVAAQVPMLMRFLQAPVGQVHLNLADAARVHGLPWGTRAADIHAPLLLSPFLWGWTMAFGQIFFELPVSELLYPAGGAPVGVAVVALNQSLRFTEASRLALAGIAVSLLVAGCTALLLRLALAVPTTQETTQ